MLLRMVSSGILLPYTREFYSSINCCFAIAANLSQLPNPVSLRNRSFWILGDLRSVYLSRVGRVCTFRNLSLGLHKLANYVVA